MTDVNIVKDKLKALAIAMIASAGISLAVSLFSLMQLGDRPIYDESQRLILRALQTLLILSLPALAFSIYGALQMMNVKKHGFAVTSAIINIVFGFSGCLLISVPVGIWALIVLLKPEIKSAFTVNLYMMEKLNSEGVPNKALNARQTINDSNRFVPLNEEEKSKLVRMRIYKFIFSLFFGLITLGAVVFVLIDYKFAFIGLYWKEVKSLLIFWTIPLGITLIMLYKYRKLSKDIKEGRKQIIVARIEKKEHSISNRDINDIQFAKYIPTHYYYIWINGRKLTYLDSSQYHRFKVGDLAELHVGPHSKRILSDLIKITDSPPTENSEKIGQYHSSV